MGPEKLQSSVGQKPAGAAAPMQGGSHDVAAPTPSERRLWESEERLRIACDLAGLGVFEWDALADRTVWENDRMYEIFGHPHAEGPPSGVQFVERYLHPDDASAARRALAGASSHGRSFQETLRIRRKDGALRWLDIAGKLELSPDGTPARVVGVVADVTERKQAEEALRINEARLNEALRVADVAVFEHDHRTDAVSSYLSPRVQDLLGWDSEEPLTLAAITNRIHAEDRERTAAAIRRSHDPAGEGSYAGETRFVRPDGTVRWFSVRARTFFEGEGDAKKPTRTVGALLDITDRKRTEEQLQRMNAELAEAARHKDEFLAQLAHELRNPLNPIRSAVEVLRQEGPPAPRLRQYRDVIDRQVSHLTRLIDDLLDVGRITRNRLELRTEPVSLAEVIEAAVESSRPLVDRHGHRLTVTLPPETVLLDADPVRLTQVFANLLNNAAKYTPDGGSISLRAERRGDEVTVSVRDTGIGIPPDKLPRLFEMFYQADGSLERAQGGLGIGLTLVRRLVEMHGGTVEARSAGTGEGAELVVRLPVLLGQPPSQPPRRPAESDGESPAPAAGAPETRGGGRPLRVLVVDDNVDSADSLAMLLELSGHEVSTAYDGLEAVDAAERLRPDVVLLDIGMPRLNGYDAARRIREQPWGRQMLLIAQTGWGQEEDRRRAREAGFDGHLTKPVDMAALARLLASPPARGGF